METEKIDFICPTHYLPYIFNADMDSLTDEEIECIDAVLDEYNLFEVIDEPFFSHRNDFNNLGNECITLNAYK